MNGELESWRKKLENIGSPEKVQSSDSEFLVRSLGDGDRDDLAIALQIESQLDSIGLVQAPDSLHKKLYAIPNTSKSSLLLKWGGGLTAAAAIILAVFSVNTPTHSDSEIAKARAELATTIQYLNRANARSRRQVQKIIGDNVERAVIKGFFQDSHQRTTESRQI